MIQLRSHKIQLEVDRPVIKYEVPREVDSLDVAEFAETGRCAEIERVAWFMPDAQKRTFKIVYSSTWHHGVLHKWVLRDHRKDDCVWRSCNLKINKEKNKTNVEMILVSIYNFALPRIQADKKWDAIYV